MIEYQDFLCYTLENDGSHKEMDVKENAIEDQLHPDDVLIFVKQDMRRLWIWKGPKAPVRKRFISSRVAAKIQEEIRQESGRHLKIVSVDAGDEPVEFLSTFNLESMEITEKLNDMVYIRNVERDRMNEEDIKSAMQGSQSKEDYWSPLLAEKGDSNPVQSSIRSISIPTKKVSPAPSYEQQSSCSLSEEPIESDSEIIQEIILKDPPIGMKRVNIIIGHRLYAPGKTTSEVFGETIETESWDAVPNLPKDVIDFTTKQIRVHVNKETSTIKAIEVFKALSSINKQRTNSNTSESDQEKIDKNRNLPKIPSADD